MRHPATLMLILGFAASSAAEDANWPQWRGPARNGVSTASGLPLEWSDGENVLWKVALEGKGHSSPVIWGDRIFLTTDVEGDVIPGATAPIHIRAGEVYQHPASQSADRSHTLKVVSLDATTGNLLWSGTVHDGRVFDNRHRVNTYATPTAITNGKLVFFYFGSQGLFAFDFDGELVWNLNFGNIATWGHGHGTSPIIHGELLILQIDQDEGEGSFLIGLHQLTGEKVWRTTRDQRVNYSSPILIQTPAGAQLVTTSYDNVIAYDPDSGRELWRSPGFLGNAVPTPVADDMMIFAVFGLSRQAHASHPSAGDRFECERSTRRLGVP